MSLLLTRTAGRQALLWRIDGESERERDKGLITTGLAQRCCQCSKADLSQRAHFTGILFIVTRTLLNSLHRDTDSPAFPSSWHGLSCISLIVTRTLRNYPHRDTDSPELPPSWHGLSWIFFIVTRTLLHFLHRDTDSPGFPSLEHWLSLSSTDPSDEFADPHGKCSVDDESTFCLFFESRRSFKVKIVAANIPSGLEKTNLSEGRRT